MLPCECDEQQVRFSCRGLVFFLGREVPREQLLVVVRAFGGAVGWEGEGSPIPESDESITHQVQRLAAIYKEEAKFSLLDAPDRRPCSY